MPIVNRIAAFHDDMVAWRRDLHAHPETAFEEQRTSDFVAAKLSEWGIEIHRGPATTGRCGAWNHTIAKNGRSSATAGADDCLGRLIAEHEAGQRS